MVSRKILAGIQDVTGAPGAGVKTWRLGWAPAALSRAVPRGSQAWEPHGCTAPPRLALAKE